MAQPMFVSIWTSVQRSAMANDYFAGLLLTRSEAIKARAPVVMCKSLDGASCAASGDWSRGWLLFHDSNLNGRFEPGETLVRVHQGLPDDWVFKGNQLVTSYVAYGSTGSTRMVSGAFQAGTLTLCRRSAQATTGTQIIISSVGRPRTQTVTLASCP